MMRHLLALATMLWLGMSQVHANPVQLFPISAVRLADGPFLDAQNTDLQYLMELDPDKLLAPYLREAGLAPKQSSYGNWESSGLDGHMGGHYLSALALMFASTGDLQVLARLNYFVSELQRCQQNSGTGYLGGIPGGSEAWKLLAAGQLKVDSFSVNGKWVPWYNLHKLFAGLRDAYRYAGNEQARSILIALSDWALQLTSVLSDDQMQEMLKSEHGGMNEVLADVAGMTGDKKYLALAIRFSHQALLTPLLRSEDTLTGLHANTQIPKVIGFERIAELTGQQDWLQAARFFWQSVVTHRTVAIGGNSVKEHFHDENDFSAMLDEVEGPETCNTYNMLKLTEMLFLNQPAGAYGDYYERALYNHILSSQHPGTGGFVYFTPMRPNHYRVYSQVDKAMWCCVGSGLESQAKYGEFIYAHSDDALYVNLFIPSTLQWHEKNLRITQDTRFPDQNQTRITVHGNAWFALHIRYPAWVAQHQMRIYVNDRPVRFSGKPGDYIALRRNWKDGDTVRVALPMRIHLEQMPDRSNYYSVLYGPIVLAAKTSLFKDEQLNFLADDTRMGHIASGQVCPLESAPILISDTLAFLDKFKPVAGQPLTFQTTGLIRGANGEKGDALRFIPFFRLHDSRYMIYWPYSTPANLATMQAQQIESDAAQQRIEAETIDSVAPGEQQPEVDHHFMGEDSVSAIHNGQRSRHASAWFSYELSDPQHETKKLSLSFSGADAGSKFDVLANDVLLGTIELQLQASTRIYSQELVVPQQLVAASQGRLVIRFVARAGSVAGDLYGLRLLR